MEIYILVTSTLTLIVAIIVLLKNSNSSQSEDIDKLIVKNESLIKDEFSRNRTENATIFKQNREEQNNSFKSFEEKLDKDIKDQNDHLKVKFENLVNIQKELNKTVEEKTEKIRESVENKLKDLQENNTKKLEEIRVTVDEKLHNTLETRLGESFKLVSDRLEKVQKGLGEMQSLANNVGDLQKVLTNVKTRGMMGEYQLENILEQILTIEQYEKNAVTKVGSTQRVEFAIKMPGQKDGKSVFLPIDAKFPVESYMTLNQAIDDNNLPEITSERKKFQDAVKKSAKDIYEKYIDPPNTTDFALMFLPIEGLFAEVMRVPGLFEEIKNKYKVILTGPTTLSALLNSLQMGFRTLAIEKRSSEVWEVLGAVKTEFGKFGDILEKTKKKLQEASNVIDKADVRTRAMERKLKDVQELSQDKTDSLLGEPEVIEHLEIEQEL
ncbi:MAG: DNA recombination protein RmuC [Candidatus Delongbacteria bacterium]|jgi:DNA recombination protein RmuC|nr:DNA recombination protein RmuC [Candidatus Delongbacteria bacterium]